MLLLLTGPPYADYDTIYQINPDHTVSKISSNVHHYITPRSTTQICTIPTPVLQLRYVIIDLLIEHYLTTGDIEAALLLISISPSTIRRFYSRTFKVPLLFGLDSPSIVQMHFRIARTFYFIYQIYESLLCLINNDRDHYYAFEFFTQRDTIPGRVYPWDFGKETVQMTDTVYPFIHNYRMFINESFVMGPQYFQIAWAVGQRTSSGYFHAKYFRVPVIPIMLYTYSGAPILRAHRAKDCVFWQGFRDIIKKLFGPSTGVYLQTETEEHYYLIEI